MSLLPEEVDGEEPVSLSLRFVDASSVDVRVPRGSPVLRLKEAVTAQRGVPPSCQRIIYLGRVLEDAECVTREHDGKVLHCLLRTAEEQARTSVSTLAVPAAPPSPGSLAAAQAQLAEVDLLMLQASLLVAAQNAAALERREGRRGSFSVGSGDQFWTGLAVGMLLGLPAMLCMMEPAASPRLRTGILCGFCLQMMLASSRLSQAEPGRSREERDAEWLDRG